MNDQITPAEPKEERTVGAEVREVRKARGLTLQDLSDRIGRSVAYLSRVERGGARLSVDLLAEIGEALNVDPKWFFPTRTGASHHERSYIVRSDSRRPLSSLYTRTFEELGFEDELLSSSLTGQFYMIMSRFPPGSDDQPAIADGYVFDGEQHGVVIQGEVELTLGTDVIRLRTGDSFSYPSTVPHRFRNRGGKEARMIWAMAPVRITW